ncbi:MAG: hypothetical protein MUP49_00010, partial [Dehalococcoidia bacterium]|nr:hypothetical protein [Dehalococcoidia bacterium]
MNNSNLYRIHPESKTLQSIKEIDFSDHSFQERYDIQEWLEATPSILGEKLLIIAKEKTYFEGTKERPDLIAMDKDGNIVIIELKRDDSGSNTDWQAIKYASYWSRFSVPDILRVYADYINKHREKEGAEEVDEEYAKQEIIDFVEQDSEENINNRQRIVLVSHRFSKEVVTAVDWLIENYGLDIRCVQIIPYFDEDKETYYLQSNTILPLLGIDEYLIRPFSGKANTEKRGHGSRNDDEVTRFFEYLRDQLIRDDMQTKNFRRPTNYSRWAGSGDKFRYYHFWFNQGLWDNWNQSYRVWLYDDSEQNRDYRNKARVFLEIRKSFLQENGVTEKQIGDLESKLASIFEKDSGFSFRTDNACIQVERLLENSGLSDSLRKELLDTISVL